MSALTSGFDVQIGRVAGLWRYPVKAMAAEALDEVQLSWHGFVGDRRWAFVRAGQAKNGFPWLTLRERPSLTLYRPSFVTPDQPNRSLVHVRTPAGTVYDVADPHLAAELGAQVMKCDRGLFDAMPLSLLTTQARTSLDELVESELDVRRFRPNLVIEATSLEGAPIRAYPEDHWVGSVLRVGKARIRVDARDQRCAVVGVDPDSAAREPAVLKAIAQNRDSRLGVYASTVHPGRVALGDPVVLESSTPRP